MEGPVPLGSVRGGLLCLRLAPRGELSPPQRQALVCSRCGAGGLSLWGLCAWEGGCQGLGGGGGGLWGQVSPQLWGSGCPIWAARGRLGELPCWGFGWWGGGWMDRGYPCGARSPDALACKGHTQKVLTGSPVPSAFPHPAGAACTSQPPHRCIDSSPGPSAPNRGAERWDGIHQE